MMKGDSSQNNKSIVRLAVFSEWDDDMAWSLRNEGIETEFFPLLSFFPVNIFRESLLNRWLELLNGSSGYLLFTSKRAVKFFSELLKTTDIHSLKQNLGQKRKVFSRVITVGPATAQEVELSLGDHGIKVDYCADTKGEGKGQAGVWEIIQGENLNPIIHIRPFYIDGFLESQLHDKGYIYEPFPIYETKPIMINRKLKEKVLSCDFLLFTSNSVVDSFGGNFRDYLRELQTHKIPLPLFVGERSWNRFQEIKNNMKIEKNSFPDLQFNGITLKPGKRLVDRVIETLKLCYKIGSREYLKNTLKEVKNGQGRD